MVYLHVCLGSTCMPGACLQRTEDNRRSPHPENEITDSCDLPEGVGN